MQKHTEFRVVQVGPEGEEQALKEAQRSIDLLKQRFGEPPDGCKLYANLYTYGGRTWDIGQSGAYYSVMAEYDDADQTAEDWAVNVVRNIPTPWDGSPLQG